MNAPHMAHFTVAYWCVFVAVLLPLVVPALVASFLYAYRSPQVWARRTGSA